MATVDVSGIAYFAPILAFLLVFVVSFAVLAKTELVGKGKYLQLFAAFLLATLFITASTVTDYVLNIVPWFAALLVSLFLLVALVSMSGKVPEGLQKGIGIFVVLALITIFIISAIVVFSDVVSPYLPFSETYVGNSFSDWIYSARVVGGVLLLIVAALVSWVLMKVK